MYFVLLVLFHIILLLNYLKIAKLSVHQITFLNVRRGKTNLTIRKPHRKCVACQPISYKLKIALNCVHLCLYLVFFVFFLFFCCHDHFSSNTLCFTVIFFLSLNILETQKLLISQSLVSRHNHDFTQSSSCLPSLKCYRIRTTHITRFESVIFFVILAGQISVLFFA